MSNLIVRLDVPIVWACGCGSPHMRIYRNGLVKCSECERHQSWIARNHSFDVIEDLARKLDRIEAKTPADPPAVMVERYAGALADIAHIGKYDPALQRVAAIAKHALIAADQERDQIMADTTDRQYECYACEEKDARIKELERSRDQWMETASKQDELLNQNSDLIDSLKTQADNLHDLANEYRNKYLEAKHGPLK